VSAQGTRAVIMGRNLLWGMIALVLAILVYTASDGNISDGARLVFSKIKQVEDLQNVMKNPDYRGLDKNNLPYSITADHATQKDATTVILSNIKADMQTRDKKWVALHAGAGEFSTTNKILTLTKNVDMFYDGGYEFRSEHAVVDVEKGSASGDAAVQAQSPMGTLTADSFTVSGRGEMIRFDGNVKVVLYRK
jgi:lipopolysaccharide export system protein LptC